MNYLVKKCKEGTVLYVNGLTPKIISIEKRQGEYVKAHFVEHINFFPIKTIDYFMSKYHFRPIIRVRISMVRTFKDALRFLGGFMLSRTSGVSFSGNFSRLYEYGPER
jgi:hypothetical protein